MTHLFARLTHITQQNAIADSQPCIEK